MVYKTILHGRQRAVLKTNYNFDRDEECSGNGEEKRKEKKFEEILGDEKAMPISHCEELSLLKPRLIKSRSFGFEIIMLEKDNSTEHKIAFYEKDIKRADAHLYNKMLDATIRVLSNHPVYRFQH